MEALYQINERFALTLGAQYSSKGGKTKLIIYEKGPAYDPSVRYVYHFRFIDVPLRLDYYFSKKKIAPFISTGISTNVAIGQLTTTFNPNAFYNENSQGFSSINLQFQLGAGVDITFEKSRLRISPLYRLSILKSDLGIDRGYYSSVYPAKQVTGRLFSFGLGLSYIFSLGHNKYKKVNTNGTRDL